MLSGFENVLRCGTIEYSLKGKDKYMTFTSDEQATAWGYSHYKDWAEEYKVQTRNAERIFYGEYSMIEYYCGYIYKSMNAYLRGEECGLTKEHVNHMVSLLTLHLCQAPCIPDDIVVYRVVSNEFANKLFNDNKNDLPTFEKGFMSTSLLDNIAANGKFAGDKYLLKIYIPKGTVGIYVNPITPRTEQEVLIAPNRQLAMIGYPQQGAHGKIVVECKLINH